MKVSDAEVIYDPYEWLPGDGELSVSHRSAGHDISVAIEYECSGTSAGLEKPKVFMRELTFRSVFYFYMAPAPGADLLNIEWDAFYDDIGSLVEFKKSELTQEAKKVWRESSGSGFVPVFRHFCIFFLSANIVYHVICSGVELGDPELLR